VISPQTPRAPNFLATGPLLFSVNSHSDVGSSENLIVQLDIVLSDINRHRA